MDSIKTQSIFDQTIDISKLNFADWQAIAAHCENSSKWGYFKWLERADLKSLTLRDWKEIAERLGYSSNWAYRQHEEHEGA